MKALKQFLHRITGFSTPLGGLSWTAAKRAPSIERFEESICVTVAVEANDRFVDFLKAQDGSVVFLRCDLDASVALEEQWRRVEEHQLDLDRIASGQFSGMWLPLPSGRDTLLGVVFHFRDGHVLAASSGGTGILMINVSGFFEVTKTHYGGPSTYFHLKEVEAPLTVKAEFMNSRAWKRLAAKIRGLTSEWS